MSKKKRPLPILDVIGDYLSFMGEVISEIWDGIRYTVTGRFKCYDCEKVYGRDTDIYYPQRNGRNRTCEHCYYERKRWL